VDPRWVEKCLRRSHKQFFVDEGIIGRRSESSAPATVADYLEKIFQIPIWMSPIESRTRASLVNSLLGPRSVSTPGDAQGAEGVAAVVSDQTIDVDVRVEPDEFLFGEKGLSDPLQITTAEAEFVDSIADLLSDRPRALKRFVNIYRLLKASLPDIERESFMAESSSSGYRVCLTQLALFTGHSRFAPVLLAALGEGADSALDNKNTTPSAGVNKSISLEDWYNGLSSTRQRELGSALKLIPNRKTLEVSEFRRWLPFTSRYLFHRAD
jgi:hypothetical protein